MNKNNFKVLAGLWFVGLLALGGIFVLVNLKEGKLFKKVDNSVPVVTQTQVADTLGVGQTNSSGQVVEQVNGQGNLQNNANEPRVSGEPTINASEIKEKLESLSPEELESITEPAGDEGFYRVPEEDDYVLRGHFDETYKGVTPPKVVNGFVKSKVLGDNIKDGYMVTLGINGRELEVNVKTNSASKFDEGSRVDITYYYENDEYILTSILKR